MLRGAIILLVFGASATAFAPTGVSLRGSKHSWSVDVISRAGASLVGPSVAAKMLRPSAAAATARRLASVATTWMMTASEKQSPLEGGGLRGIEEEERRISMWRAKFELDDDQMESLRQKFEVALVGPGEFRTISKSTMKNVIESVNRDVDLANIVAEGQRPVVSEDELNNYVKALPELWAEACDADAIEVANGECEVPLDTQNFDLSEVVAIYGMCVRDHCGIGGVCFWDSD